MLWCSNFQNRIIRFNPIEVTANQQSSGFQKFSKSVGSFSWGKGWISWYIYGQLKAKGIKCAWWMLMLLHPDTASTLNKSRLKPSFPFIIKWKWTRLEKQNKKIYHRFENQHHIYFILYILCPINILTLIYIKIDV